MVRTHSTWATAWAQAQRAIPVLGTTHADLCPGPVPVTRALTPEEVAGDYEAATGAVVLEAMAGVSLAEVPAVLVRGHGPFTKGCDPAAAVVAVVALEVVAETALLTQLLDPGGPLLPPFLTQRHFSRKHGAGVYYGQPR